MSKVGVCCGKCGSLFFAKQSDINRGWGKYCSRKCSAKKNVNFAALLQGRSVREVRENL